NSVIGGDKLLKTIHLLSDSEVVSPTVENITKSYINDITTYYDLKPKIEEALNFLVEAKVLLLSNNNYKITSDLEGKLLEEMKDIDVELFIKKRLLINCLKEYKIFAPVATFNAGSDSFKYSVLSDQDDELCPTGNKQLKLIVYSLFNISDNRQDFIEQLKLDTQYNKDSITLIPDNNDFFQIDKLLGEIKRYTQIEEKYANETDAAKRQIIRDFALIREEKEKHLRITIEKAYNNATLIYMFDELLLNADSFKATISDLQKKLVKNIYTKRLATQLSEGLVPKIFSARKEDLGHVFLGNDFKFYDGNGNFTGDHLKVVEEINAKITSRFIDGKSLESDLSGAPWGYSYGTLVSTLAALLRAGRLSVKYNGDTYFSHDQKAVHEAFTNATKFKSASFKSITATLTASDKTKAVQILRDLEIESHTNRKVDWNISDFDLADAIRCLADHFIAAFTTLYDTVENFDVLFPKVAEQKTVLLDYSSKVTENNYIEKVEHLLNTSDSFTSAIQAILKAQKFIKINFSAVNGFKRFIEEVIAELKKADRVDDTIQDAHVEFLRLYQQDMVKNFAQLQQQAQLVKDSYFKLLKNAASAMTHEYQLLQGKVEGVNRNLKQNYPSELNVQNQKRLDNLKQYCADRIIGEPSLVFTITCKNCGYSLSDILNYSALVPAKDSELLIIQGSFIAESAVEPEISTDPEKPTQPKLPRKISLQVPSKFMTVQEYKFLLMAQITALAAARPDEQIELAIETLDKDF
ncbi:MAG: BREX system P-loop protein BrxC, partial [Bacteroidia bacterium]